VGRNVSQCRKDTAPLVLCPPSDGKDETGQKDEKAKKAFDIATVDNPKGPFNGFEYVSRNRVYIHQIALLNSNLFPGSPHRWADPEHPGQTITWRDFNLRKGINVARLIDAISQHEGWGRGGSAKDPKASGHAGATQLALRAEPQKNDPAIILEQMFDRSEAKLEDKARTKLMNADIALITAAQDPLPPIGSGALWLWAPSMHRWLHCNVTVGGEDLDADCGDD